MPFPYTQSREVYSIPPRGGIPVNPTGDMPTDPNRNRDLIGNVIDPAMEPDRGIGSAPPRDPYTASLPPVSGPASSAPAVTRLSPGRTTPFSRADAQALAALDPRSLQEAKDIAALPESTPAQMTATFGGKSFSMQPSARVDRNVLARLYGQGVERKGQERQDAVRGQIQTGNESLARIPGQNAVDLAKQQGQDKIGAINAEGAIQAPTREANVAKSNAEVAAMTGKEKRDQGAYDRANDPVERQLKAEEEALARAEASPFASTPVGRADIAARRAFILTRRGVPEADAAKLAADIPDPEASMKAVGDFMADPQTTAIMADIKNNQQGLTTNRTRGAKQAAARQVLENHIANYAKAKGADPEQLRTQLQSQLIGTDAPASLSDRGLWNMIKGLLGQ